MKSSICIILIWCVFIPLQLLYGQSVGHEKFSLALHDNWRIQSFAKTKARGEQLSSVFDVSSWYATEVPSTVLGALVKNNEYPDIFMGRNLDLVPKERFGVPWWYRTEFDLTGTDVFRFASLVFEGLNYRADIWLNGRQIGKADSVFGAFRQFELDVSGLLTDGKNYLAVRIQPPQPGDFTIGFVDWNPEPPDHNMGIWRGVRLERNQGISIEKPFIATDIDTADLKTAKLTISGMLRNHSDSDIKGEVTGRIGDITFSRQIALRGKEETDFSFTPDDYKQLILKDPRLWWPHNLGEPELYDLDLSVTSDGSISDRKDIRFGVRKVEDYINAQGYRGYKINGKKILIKGGGWVDGMLLNDDKDKIDAQLRYVRHMNLNTIRLEGFWGSSETLYNLADQYGILVMPGWSCQWEWEGYLGKETDKFGGIKTEADMNLILHSLEDQITWLRNHPSIFVWVLGSDKLPRPELEQKYKILLDRTDLTRPTLASCSSHRSEITGPTAVKMNGPYDYVTPNYWYVDRKKGGAFGFNTETGPGPQPPPLESLRKMIPEDSLWPVNEVWEFHCGRNEFNSLKRYLNAFEKRYWKAQSVEEFSQVAQIMNYEAMRAMFESFGANKPVATGIIQWMLNSAWPEMFWQLYDFYLMPNGAFYGAKKASQPLNIAYNYGDRSIRLINDTYQSFENLTVSVKVYDIQSNLCYEKEIRTGINAYGAKNVLDLPGFENISSTYFIALQLSGDQKTRAGNNFYWLSTSEDVIDPDDDSWFVTRNLSFADFSALKNLPGAQVQAKIRFEDMEKEQTATVDLENTSGRIAFFIALDIVRKKTGGSVLPVFWEDNYLSLLPGEKRTIRARYEIRSLNGEEPVFRLRGLNVSGSGAD